ncbi:MAG: hypothetical protein EOO73_15220 [Myxococcales bacterium]|nr:MAG: hypothetical protein EOO73_15220 [Myxococcales bacterium]
MQSPAIQAALNNLVETIRTSLMAEFLELLRSGKPASLKPARKSKRAARPVKTPAKKAARKASR